MEYLSAERFTACTADNTGALQFARLLRDILLDLLYMFDDSDGHLDEMSDRARSLAAAYPLCDLDGDALALDAWRLATLRCRTAFFVPFGGLADRLTAVAAAATAASVTASTAAVRPMAFSNLVTAWMPIGMAWLSFPLVWLSARAAVKVHRSIYFS